MKTYKKPAAADLQQKLTPEQYAITQKAGTERAFANAYWNNTEPGIYVDVVSGEPLFSSLDKYDSGTGWPSFTQPLAKQNIVTREDRKLLMTRTEVRSKHGDSHLGHVFDDGPGPEGLRYCMNSAALRFIPVNKLVEEGYGEYLALFQNADKNKTSTKSETKATMSNKYQTATLAGGCFWGVEHLLRELPGVIDTEVGYTGGIGDNPTYEIVKKGNSGHAEAIQVTFDPEKVRYEDILLYFFRLHDPTTLNRQGNDVGTQYRSVIFYHGDEQKKAAEQIKTEVDKSGKWKNKVVTDIVAAGKFYPAESYHQDYLKKNPGGYTCHYLR